MVRDELERAFTDGQLSRRAFVRQMVDGGMDMPAALALADQLVPREAPAAPPPAVPANGGAGRPLPARPAQVADLDVTVVQDGYVVHDARRDRMHSLNATAALVFELCTGENDDAQIAALVQKACGLDAPPVAEARQCLETFFDEGLIR